LAAKKPLSRKARGSLPPRSYSIVRSYGTLALHRRPVQQSYTQSSSLTTTICLAGSVITLAIVSVLANTRRRRFGREVDIAVFAGAAASLVFAIFGMVAAVRKLLRHDGVGRVGGGTAVVLFVAVCVGNGG